MSAGSGGGPLTIILPLLMSTNVSLDLATHSDTLQFAGNLVAGKVGECLSICIRKYLVCPLITVVSIEYNFCLRYMYRKSGCMKRSSRFCMIHGMLRISDGFSHVLESIIRNISEDVY